LNNKRKQAHPSNCVLAATETITVKIVQVESLHVLQIVSFCRYNKNHRKMAATIKVYNTKHDATITSTFLIHLYMLLVVEAF